MTVCNIAAALAEIGKRLPDTPGLIAATGLESGRPRTESITTFAQLDARSDRIARGLASLGVARGSRAALMVPPSPDFFALTFALFKLGVVVVLIDPGMGVRNLGVCLNEAAPETFIGVGKAQLARVFLGWASKSLKRTVTVGRPWFFGGPSLREVERRGEKGGPVLAPTTPDEVAAILFTSGSTGVAKGAVYTHGVFVAQVEHLRRLYGIEPGEVDLPTFPLFGLFGPALGMTAVIPEMDSTRPGSVDPRRILNAVRHYRVTNLFGSPALLRRVAFSPEASGLKLPTLRRVISAGAPVPAAVISRVTDLLSPGVQVHTPYGATEALPVATIGSDTILGETAALTAKGKGVCVGFPVQGVTVRVMRITDEPVAMWDDALEVPRGEIGEIVVEGDVVTKSYFNRPASTALHKMRRGDATLHRMGDVGYLDDTGRIWFCGRKSHRVTLDDARTLFTIPCEAVFNNHAKVFRTALVGVKRRGKTLPVICVELDPRLKKHERPDKDRASKSAFFAELRALGSGYEHTREITAFAVHPAFPVDIRHNAKIFREKLAAWAGGLSDLGGG